MIINGKNIPVKNSVISRIKQVISSPSNQLLANEPIEIDMWHEAADKALIRKGTPDLLSSWLVFLKIMVLIIISIFLIS